MLNLIHIEFKGDSYVMKTKKIISLILCTLLLLTSFSFCSFAIEEDLQYLESLFVFGQGPETEGYSIDYRYFSPVKEDDTTKYPLVIWLHGMGNGKKDGSQLGGSNIGYWASGEFQARFKDAGGAFIFAPRSLEEYDIYWDDELIFPLRRAIDSFIAENAENIDVKRIYIGGYSMGGKMTLKMATAYPEMFAAAFPVCPAWVPGKEASEVLKDMPVWLTSGAPDPLVNYFLMATPTWNNLKEKSSSPENLRFSTLSVVTYENGRLASSAHLSWYSVNHDMFSKRNGDYPFMKTIDGNGNKVNLTYPDGMISWLSGFESNYDGSAATDSGNSAITDDGYITGLRIFTEYMKNFFGYIFSFVR